MVRAYAVKGKKRKKREEKYDREEEEEQQQQQQQQQQDVAEQEPPEEEHDAKRAMTERTSDVEDEEEKEEVNELEGIPIAPSELNVANKPKIVFILERASLEVAKVGKTYQLLNSDDHASFLRRNNRNPADYRPDIVHQALLMMLDSRLNKSGRLQAVYVKTEKGVLIEVKPHARLPRTFKRFSGLMLQLLQKLSTTAVGKREKLLRVIKNPVSQYLPVNSRKIGFSYSSDKLININNYVASASSDSDFVFVLGAMAHGKIDKDYADDFISISGFPLSAAYCITMITNALEAKYNIL